jgi:hypothetical protein
LLLLLCVVGFGLIFFVLHYTIMFFKLAIFYCDFYM